MDTFLSKKLNPYLFPFKKKTGIPHLYPSKIKFPVDKPFYRNEQLLQIDMINEIATNTVFQSSSTQVHITNLTGNETCRDSGFQTKPNLIEASSMLSEKTTMFEMLKTFTETFEKPNIADTTSERQRPLNMLNGSEPCIKGLKTNDVALEIPMVVTMSSESNLAASSGVRPMYAAFQTPVTSLEKPQTTYLCFERPDVLEKLRPKEINWTRIDMTQQKMEVIPAWVKVIMGVVCGMVASAVVHPLDVVKVRLQLFPKQQTTLCMMQRIVACEGLRGLYAGLTAGMLRQITYTGTRLTVYHSLYANYKETHGESPGFHQRLRIAVIAGLAGAFMGVPSEVALVRMIEVRRLRRSPCSPPCSRACKHVHRPEGALRQLRRIARREGVTTWWRGLVSTLVRSILVTTTQVGIYSEVREAFTLGDLVFRTGPYLHFYVAGISSIFSAVLSLPVDQVKTKCQSYQERHRPGLEIFNEMLKKKGVRYLWKGFLPYYLRQAVHTMITYVLLDQFIDIYYEYHQSIEGNKTK